MPEGNILSIAGVVHEILPMQEGEGQRGHWQRQSFVVEVPGRYPYFVCFDVWDAEQISILSTLQKGASVVVSFDVSSREYNGRWFSSLRAWRITLSGAASVAPQQPAGASVGVAQQPQQPMAVSQQAVTSQQVSQQAVAYTDTSSVEQEYLGVPVDSDLPF